MCFSSRFLNNFFKRPSGYSYLYSLLYPALLPLTPLKPSPIIPPLPFIPFHSLSPPLKPPKGTRAAWIGLNGFKQKRRHRVGWEGRGNLGGVGEERNAIKTHGTKFWKCEVSAWPQDFHNFISWCIKSLPIFLEGVFLNLNSCLLDLNVWGCFVYPVPCAL